MANYLLVYHGGSMPESPEEGQKVMQAWTDWFERLGDALVDGGNPVSEVRTIANNGTVSGGGINPASGYSVIKADSLDAAVALAKGCPLLNGGGGSVEVAETVAM
ncbi:MAG TPA: hypothetical protein VFV66_14395 [Nonomuraea sp.]|nr:hypothetical protein [Nonomuraea sp.]